MNRPARLALALAVALLPAAASALSFYPPVSTMPTKYDEDSYRRFVAATVADLDGDGAVDVLLSEHDPGVRLRQFRIGPDRTLVFVRDDAVPGFGTLYSEHVLQTGDVDGDGRPELLVGDPYRRWVAILSRKADGTWTERARLPHPFGEGSDLPSILVRDLNGDDVPDVPVHHVREAYLYVGGGGWTFAEPKMMASHGQNQAVWEDLDGDGRPELLAAGDANYPGFGIAWGASGPHRTRAMEFVPFDPPSGTEVVVRGGDLDDDGFREVVVAHADIYVVGATQHFDWTLSTYEAGPDRTLTPPVKRLVRSWINTLELNMEVADFDRDGDDDVVTRYNGRGDVMTFENGGMTVWQLPIVNHAANGVPSHNLFVADLTGDGCPDVAELGAYAFAVHAQRGGCGTAPAAAPVRRKIAERR